MRLFFSRAIAGGGIDHANYSAVRPLAMGFSRAQLHAVLPGATSGCSDAILYRCMDGINHSDVVIF